MITLRYFLMCLALPLLIVSCKREKEPDPANGGGSGKIYPQYLPLKVGNYWIYSIYEVDTNGNAILLPDYDSCYIEKDTVIGSNKYYKYYSQDKVDPGQSYRYIRDSSDCLVTPGGSIMFSSENFTDTFYSFYQLAGNDTFGLYFLKMTDKDLSVSVPAGVFKTSSHIQSFKYWKINKTTDMYWRYCENVGVISQTLTRFIAPHPGKDPYKERRLLRYHVN